MNKEEEIVDLRLKMMRNLYKLLECLSEKGKVKEINGESVDEWLTEFKEFFRSSPFKDKNFTP